MKTQQLIIGIGALAFAGVLMLVLRGPETSSVLPSFETTNKKEISQLPATLSPTPLIYLEATASAMVQNVPQVPQTFNNCGPATLSMVMSWAGTPRDQNYLGSVMRPYQNPAGDNDDKSISSAEFVRWAQEFELYAINRPNGTIDLLKTFTTNGIPVVVKSWLNPNEDIGHFRVITGFNENTQTLFYQDSYNGPDLAMSYQEFQGMWQPFHYEYFIVVPPRLEPMVTSIVGTEMDKSIAWRNTIDRANQELITDATAVYPWFNIAVASYYLGDYQESVNAYEQVANRLPRRMLWYQIEPIQSYAELGNTAQVITLTDAILSDQNRAFSELYLIRGNLYLKQGQTEAAREEFEQAILYNKNLTEAQEALNKL